MRGKYLISEDYFAKITFFICYNEAHVALFVLKQVTKILKKDTIY
ncbi:MAG: hypothetical protein RLZZ323_566 [Bacteroidota bacterium]|jgi:hypothetical protein